jgi:hypothetical protein
VIPHSNGHEENTDVVLREFLNSELGISDANEIPFQNVHLLAGWKIHVSLPFASVIVTMWGYEGQPPKSSSTNQHFLLIGNIHGKYITGTNCSYQN